MTDPSPILSRLFAMQDVQYRDFQCKLIPNVPSDLFIGIRTPDLRKYARELYKEEKDPAAGSIRQDSFLEAFLEDLPHQYFDENQKVFKKNRDALLPCLRKWISSDHTYTVRFAIGMLMQHYLDDAFDPSYPELIASVQSEEYYVRMMIAWYFATALAKQYDAVLPFLEERRLDPWTHNRTIQKAVESYRITPEQKTYLRSLKIPMRSSSKK